PSAASISCMSHCVIFFASSGESVGKVAGLIALSDEAGELRDLRHRRRRSAVGERQASADQVIHAVPGALGAPALLERDGGSLSHLLGEGLPCRGVCGELGTGAPDAGSPSGPRRG